MRHIEMFSAAIIGTSGKLFQPGAKTELAFFGRTYTGRIAVLDGQLAEPCYSARRMGLVVVRERIGDPNAYIDRLPLYCTLRNENGGRSMWLGGHEGNMEEGILELNVGCAAFKGYDIVPVEPPDTLAAHGMAVAYANTPIETMLAGAASEVAMPSTAAV
ncbi:MAG TPA: hypothetical protein VGO07_06725 [Candidatus Saccharimonadales bacterium]|jgi:hypothetical protein|nr:hypothetical protein [Candidatus Saccharimonadales bacterium]